MINKDKETEIRSRISKFRGLNHSYFHPVKPYNLKSILQGFIFFLPLIYVMIYIIGFMKYLGHMSAYGLNSTEFQIPVDTVLLWGVLAILPGLKYWLILPLLLIGYMIFIISALLAHKPRKIISSWLNKLTSKIPKPKKNSPGDLASVKYMIYKADATMTFIIQFFFCFMIIFIPILIGYISMEQGKDEAKKDKEKFLSLQKHNIYISPELTNAPYMRIACNTTHCAFWNTEGTILLRHDQVQKIFLQNDKE